MDDVWLNRSGIVLNVLAGFLLAPQLIGRGRIRAFEGWLGGALPDLHASLSRLRSNLSPNRWAPPVVSITTLGGLIWIVAVNLGPPHVRTIAADILDELLIFVGLTYIAYLVSVAIASADIIVGGFARLLSRRRLVGVMVLVGIFAFVLGNSLQLIATF